MRETSERGSPDGAQRNPGRAEKAATLTRISLRFIRATATSRAQKNQKPTYMKNAK
jgi:hypothetical protein